MDVGDKLKKKHDTKSSNAIANKNLTRNVPIKYNNRTLQSSNVQQVKKKSDNIELKLRPFEFLKVR